MLNVARLLRPHAGVDVVFHILAELAERLARDGQGLRIAAAIHDKVEEVNAPVDESAAARMRLGGEIAAEAGNRPVCSE